MKMYIMGRGVDSGFRYDKYGDGKIYDFRGRLKSSRYLTGLHTPIQAKLLEVLYDLSRV